MSLVQGDKTDETGQRLQRWDWGLVMKLELPLQVRLERARVAGLVRDLEVAWAPRKKTGSAEGCTTIG